MKVINVRVTDKVKLMGIKEGDSILNANFPLKLAEGNYKSVIMNFEFASSTWTEKALTKFATFKINESKKVQVELTSLNGYANACYVPYDVFQENCKVEVGVYGIAKSGGNAEKIVSTEVIKMLIVDGSYNERLREENDISSSNAEKLEKQIADLTLVVNDKVNKETGKGLSTNDYTTIEKNKLRDIPTPNTISVKNDLKDLFKNISYNASNGVLTFTRYNNTTLDIDLPLELIVSSGSYDSTTKSIILTLANNDTISIPVSDLVNEYYADGTTLELKTVNGKLTFGVKNNKFVEKETGKGLSSNDFTNTYKSNVDSNTTARHTHSNKSILDGTTASFKTEDKTKLDGIESNAQVNKIEKIIVNGTEQVITNKTVTINIQGGIVPSLPAPDNVSNIVLIPKYKRVVIKWSDPEDNSETDVVWKGTKLVMTTGNYPVSMYDGETLVDNQVRNQYASDGFVVNNLSNDVDYYFQLFPYSDEGGVNGNEDNRVTGTPMIYSPLTVTNLKVTSKDSILKIRWNDPENTVVDDETVSTWAGTKVVMKVGGYPESITDGILVVDNQVKNQYANGYEINNLTNGQTYYFRLFPYSTDGIYNTDVANKITGIPNIVTASVYGIKRQISSTSPAWERLEDAVGLQADATKDGSNVVNDFDELYPWSDIISYNYDTATQEIKAYFGDPTFKFDGTNGEVLTRIPEFWYKRYREDGYEYIYIATEEMDDYIHVAQFSVGRYTSSGTSAGLHSKSGVLPLRSANITNFRTYSKALGADFGQMDWRYFILQLLYLVEYANYDSQTILGNGNVNGSVINSGGCDTLGMKSGCLANDSRHSVIYRGIEDIFGNIYQFVDGINIKDYVAYICYDPSKYVVDKFDGDYTVVGYNNHSSNVSWCKELGYDSNNPLISFPRVSGGSSTTYTCDNYYCSRGNKIVLVGGRWTYGLYCGLWCWSCTNTSSSSSSNFGSRLLRYQ